MAFEREGFPELGSIPEGRNPTFRFTLNGTGNPTIDYGGSWIKSAVHVGGQSTITVTLKDSIRDVLTQAADWRDPGGGSAGQYATIGQYTNEGSTVGAALTFVIAFFTAGGTPVTDPTGKVGGFISLTNSGIPY